MHLTLTEPLKNRLPILIALLVYLAFVIIDLGLGTFEPKHLYLFPLILVCLFLPALVLFFLFVELVILLWMNDNLGWGMISISVVLAGVVATMLVL